METFENMAQRYYPDICPNTSEQRMQFMFRPIKAEPAFGRFVSGILSSMKRRGRNGSYAIEGDSIADRYLWEHKMSSMSR